MAIPGNVKGIPSKYNFVMASAAKQSSKLADSADCGSSRPFGAFHEPSDYSSLRAKRGKLRSPRCRHCEAAGRGSRDDGLISLKRVVLRALAAGAVFALAGCAVAPSEPERTAAAVQPVFPAPPAAARFRFERTLYGAKDVLGQAEGAALRKFLHHDHQGTGPGLASPHALAVDRGRVFVSDLAERQIDVFDIPGRRYYRIGAAGPGTLQKPLGLSIDRAAGRLFVADAGANAVLVFDEQGQYQRSIGGPQWFTHLFSVTADPDGERIYAIDSGEGGKGEARVRVFAARDGRHLFDFGERGSGPGEFNTPYDLAVGSGGKLYVTDSGNFRVQIFDHQGKYLRSFGTVGTRPGQFGRPKAIAADAAGEVYVVDALLGNFQVFDARGAFLFAVGGHGEDGGPLSYLLPSGIAIDADGSVYFLDQGYRRIDVFRPLP